MSKQENWERAATAIFRASGFNEAQISTALSVIADNRKQAEKIGYDAAIQHATQQLQSVVQGGDVPSPIVVAPKFDVVVDIPPPASDLPPPPAATEADA